MYIPKWVPQTFKPSSLGGWDKVWEAMTPEERQKSFLFFDLPVVLIALGFMLYGLSR